MHQESDSDFFMESVPCNLCGSWEQIPKYRGRTAVSLEEPVNSFNPDGNKVCLETIVKCQSCSLIYLSPRHKKSFILQGYQQGETAQYLSQETARIKNFKSCLKAISRYRTQGKLLDVGAAAGYFLKVAKEGGWQTWGVEPSETLSRYGSQKFGLDIHCGDLASFPNPNDKMDVVTLWDVLEHTTDPKAELKKCNRLLATDGLVVINYPNIGNWLARLAGRRYWFILTVHLYYFVPKTMRAMLSETGFEVLKSAPHFQSLELGYLFSRLESYFPKTGKLFSQIANKIGISGILIPYFAAQTRVIAKKIREV